VPAKRRIAFPAFTSPTATVPLVIVGGGLAGVMTAFACAAAGLEVLLLEADRIGLGGSGHGSGVFAAEATESFRALEERAGRRAARAHFEASRRAAHDLAKTAKRLGIRGIEARDAYRVVPRAWATKELEREAALRRDAGHGASWQKPAAVTTAIGAETEGAMRLPGWGQCDPYQLLLGFARGAVARGAVLHERTAVAKITFNRKIAVVHTARSTITAAKVVICTGEPTALVKALRRHFSFRERYLALTDPLPPAVRKEVGARATIVCDIERPPHQIRWTGDHRVVVAGADGPATSARGKEKLLPSRTGQLMYEMTKLYPAISGVQPGFGWSMPLAHSADDVLYAGPHRNFPHQLFAFGTAHDPARCYLASRILLRHLTAATTSDDEHFGFARNL
jgi:glycine/D-amino acid oxidase-like deaminating enzyme